MLLFGCLFECGGILLLVVSHQSNSKPSISQTLSQIGLLLRLDPSDHHNYVNSADRPMDPQHR